MDDEWQVTKAEWARMKKNWAEVWRQIRLARAQKHAVKAAMINLKNDMPVTGSIIAKALEYSITEDK